MTGANTNMQKTILVTDAERGSALSFVRSVGRAGYRVIATSKLEGALSFRSVSTYDCIETPDPHTQPDQFTAAILDAVERFNVDLIVPITEDSLIPLSEARARFEGKALLAIAESEALATALNKERTLACAAELGIPCPTTHFVRTKADLYKIQSQLSWPVVVKPQFSLAQSIDPGSLEECKISYAARQSKIERSIELASGRYGFLLQNYCGGRGVGIELLAWNGEVQSAFQHVRLAEVPITGGASALRMSTKPDPDLLEHSRRLVKKLNWSGLCMIEFRGEGANARLMEMNGRVWGSLPLAVQSGMDFPAKLANIMLGGTAPYTPKTRQDIDINYHYNYKAYNPDLLIVWFVNVLRGINSIVPRPTRMDALRMIPVYWRATSDLYDPFDKAPARGTIKRLIRKIAAKFVAPNVE